MVFGEEIILRAVSTELKHRCVAKFRGLCHELNCYVVMYNVMFVYGAPYRKEVCRAQLGGSVQFDFTKVSI